ncbi:hypothetical protein GCM10027589_05920 [Actinocorallia lasiicapitis]
MGGQMKMRRYYADDEGDFEAESNPPQPIGTPRPGHGTIYYNTTDRAKLIWHATWLDEFPEPDPTGAIYGVTSFEGTRDEVLTWIKTQPAARRINNGDDGPDPWR